MNAIPTIYKDIQFRSRLEAKWAAFFDLAGWDWEYEPFDLAGWIPDFYVWPHCGRQGGGWLVEVKPALALDQFDVSRYQSQLASCGVSGCEGIALLGAVIHRHYLGRKAYDPGVDLDGCQLGWFLNICRGRMVGRNYMLSTPDEYKFKADEPNALFLYSVAEYWEGEKIWKEATNIVQWKSPR